MEPRNRESTPMEVKPTPYGVVLNQTIPLPWLVSIVLGGLGAAISIYIQLKTTASIAADTRIAVERLVEVVNTKNIKDIEHDQRINEHERRLNLLERSVIK